MEKITTILTPEQQRILDVLSQEKLICQQFYLTGGTALAEFHLLHRLSEDLDFFSEDEFDPQGVFSILKKIKSKTGIVSIDYQQSFNRNLFFLHLKHEVIKTEFTYFPFPRIEKTEKYGKLAVDSLLDIAVNKVFTIYQNPRSRDFIDLFFILEKTKWHIVDLIKKAKIKFDWHVDPLQLGAQFLQAKVLKDYPRMILKLKPEIWQEFFVVESNKLGKNIFE